MLDALVLPLLAVTVIGFVVYVWVSWVSKEDERSLKIEEPTEGDPEVERRR